MNANARWQEVISENLASASIPGFKRQDISFSAIEAGVATNQTGPHRLLLPRAEVATSFAPGEIRQTDVSTDVAIDGAGFFEVRLPGGALAYTRDGEFQLNAQGQLVTKHGYQVMGKNGPIQLDIAASGPITISSSGEVTQAGEVRGSLKIVEFAEPRLLRQVSGGCFLADHPSLFPQEVEQPSLRQGFLEAANTSTVMEMANLIRVMRGFEANQKLMQVQDERMGKVISELGNPT